MRPFVHSFVPKFSTQSDSGRIFSQLGLLILTFTSCQCVLCVCLQCLLVCLSVRMFICRSSLFIFLLLLLLLFLLHLLLLLHLMLLNFSFQDKRRDRRMNSSSAWHAYLHEEEILPCLTGKYIGLNLYNQGQIFIHI